MLAASLPDVHAPPGQLHVEVNNRWLTRGALIIWAVAVVGLGMTVSVFFLARDWDRAHAQAQFDKLVNARNQALQRTIDANVEVLYQIRAFIQASRRVERHEFRIFASDALARHPELHSLQWRPHVDGGQRGHFEQRVKAQGFADFSIVDATARGAFVPAPRRREYFPVLYTEPLTETRQMLGMDMADSPARQAALARAKRANGPVASGKFELYEHLPPDEDASALILYLPVAAPDTGGSASPLVGLAAAVMTVEPLVRSALRGLAADGVEIALFDERARGQARELYRSSKQSGDSFGTEPVMQRVSHVRMAGRTFSVLHSVGSPYRDERTASPQLLLLVGLLFTAFLCHRLHADQQRVLQVERLAENLSDEVRARTASEALVRAAEERLQRQNEVLMELARGRLTDAVDLNQGLAAVTKAAAETLDVQHVGVWLFNSERSAIECIDLYDRDSRLHDAGAVLEADDYPAYFGALLQERSIAAEDAHADPRTREFSAGYLTPKSIGAMLDAPVCLGGRCIGVVCHEHRGGSRAWTLDEQNFAGSIADLVSLTLEVWEHKRDETALRLSEARYRSLVMATSQIVWICARAGDCVEPSPSWEAYSGQTFEQYRALGWAQVVHPEDRARLGPGSPWAGGVPASGVYEFEYRIRRHDGVYRLFSVRGCKVRGSDGLTREWVGACQDVTDIRAAERALKRSHQRLEEKVAERTRELAQANARLRELDRLKSEFLATMSHELRTPLNSIIGFTGILRQGIAGAVNDEQRKQLGMVSHAAKHLLSLINDLLDLSRIESDRMEVTADTFACESVVAEVMQCLTPQITQKGLHLESEVAASLPLLCTDRKKVFQILLNLANNAVKFTERGQVRIVVGTDQDMLRARVEDTGIGIKPENLPLLFEAFRQVEGSARRRYEGTGLGLHLSQRLARLLGGRIEAESEYAKGSRFTVVLPLRKGVA